MISSPLLELTVFLCLEVQMKLSFQTTIICVELSCHKSVIVHTVEIRASLFVMKEGGC